MFDDSAKNLRTEVEAAIDGRKLHTDCSAKLVKRYASANYRTDWTGDEKGRNFEAHEFEYTVNTVPSLVHTNPAVEVKGLLAGVDDQAQEALDAAYPQWIESSGFAEKLQPVAYDVQFDFGVVMVGLGELPGYENDPAPVPLWPVVHRVSPRRFFIDPQATSFETARFMGHVWVRDKDELQNDPTFDPVAVGALTPDADADTARATVQASGGTSGVKRNEVVGYEIWVRDTNMVYTMGVSVGDGAYLRKPRPWIGDPKQGPYVMFGIYCVPDQVYPLPMLAVTAGVVNEINAHASAESTSAATAKRIIVYDSQNKEAKIAVTASKNGDCVGIPGLGTGAVQTLDIGGPQPEVQQYVDRLRERLDRLSGLTETMRGEITGATAAEIDEAAQGTDNRSRYARSRFRSSVERVLRSVGYFFLHCDQVAFLCNVKNPETGQMEVAQFVGGQVEGQDPRMHDRMSVSIEPFSMEMTDQGAMQRRAAFMSEWLGQYAPIMPQTPWIEWENITDDICESMNIKGGGKRYINFEMMKVVQMTMVAAQAQQNQMGQDAHGKQMAEPPPGKKGTAKA